MPANLTADFKKARERLRTASTPEEKLAALEEMLATIPKHKGTDKMQADIKRRIAKLRESGGGGKKGQRSGLDHIPKDGAGQVVLIGAPNSGKSSLLAALTNAKPEVASYPFSSLIPVPGMMAFEDVSIQLIDLPPLTAEYTEGWVYGLIRAADLAIVVLDARERELAVDRIAEILLLLEERHVVLVAGDEETGVDERTREIPCRVVLSKVDLAGESAGNLDDSPFRTIETSTATGEGLDRLRAEIFNALRVVRIYTKLPGKKPDMEEPYTLTIGSTVLDAVRLVHRDFVDQLKYVRIWGSGRFDGQQVPSDHVLEDGDVIEIHVG
ncbi:GTPase [Candidatus Bipolaricaulota bacterium]